MRSFVLVAVVSLGLLIPAGAQTHPGLDGTWTMVKSRSQYPAAAATEVIHQQGEAVDITFSEKSPGHSTDPMQMHLTTDNKPSVNTIRGNKFTSTTHWEGAKLVTFVQGDRGQHMTETRELSADGKELTVTGFHQDELTKPYYVRVMVRSEQ